VFCVSLCGGVFFFFFLLGFGELSWGGLFFSFGLGVGFFWEGFFFFEFSGGGRGVLFFCFVILKFLWVVFGFVGFFFWG